MSSFATTRTLFFFLLIPFLTAQTATEVEITAEPSHHLALENEYVRVFKVEVPAHAATLMHRHRHDYVYVTLGDAHLSNEVEGKPPVEVKLADAIRDLCREICPRRQESVRPAVSQCDDRVVAG